MIIGTFDYNREQDTFLGDIVTVNFQLECVTFKPNERQNDKQPHYRITAPTNSGHVDLGAGWKHEAGTAKPFVSVELNGPLLPGPVYAVLFPDDDGQSAALVWKGSKPKSKSDQLKKSE